MAELKFSKGEIVLYKGNEVTIVSLPTEAELRNSADPIYGFTTGKTDAKFYGRQKEFQKISDMLFHKYNTRKSIPSGFFSVHSDFGETTISAKQVVAYYSESEGKTAIVTDNCGPILLVNESLSQIDQLIRDCTE